MWLQAGLATSTNTNKSQGKKGGIEKWDEGEHCRFLAAGLACQVAVLTVESGIRAYAWELTETAFFIDECWQTLAPEHSRVAGAAVQGAMVGVWYVHKFTLHF